MSDTGLQSRTGWLGGLDGLRAIAVTAVVVFHFLPGVLPGGFLGVDLFFVLSGFLITRLLLGEIDTFGSVSLRDFYLRRARRLLPAAFLVVAVVFVGAVLFWPDELTSLHGAVPAAVFYVSNWWLIGDHQSYFVSSGRPSMLQHFWSLAIEEQFYLLWPLLLGLFVGAYFWRRRATVLTARRLALLALSATVLAGASTFAMGVIAVRTDVPYGADSSRIYFGTDTHAMGLLLGAAAAALVVLARFTPRRLRLRGAALTDLLALASLAALVVVMRQVGEFDPGLYRGGFLAVSVLCVVAVVTVSRRGSAVGWVLDRAPLRWLGQRSYAIYLWHWPVAVITRPGLDIAAPDAVVLLLRVVLTLALAEIGYRFVEHPIRSGGLAGLARTWRLQRLSATARSRLAPVGLVACLAAGVGAASGVAPRLLDAQARPASSSSLAGSVLPSGGAQPLPDADSRAATAPREGGPHPTGPGEGSGSAAQSAPVPQSVPPVTPTPPASTPPPPAPPAPAPAPPAAPAPAPVPLGVVSGFGDSVMLGASRALGAAIPGMQVHAVEGRQARAVFADVDARRAAGQLGDAVVIHTGDNGIVSPADLRATLRSLANLRRVVVVTDRVPRDWEGPNNATLRAVTGEFSNAALADWHAASEGQSGWVVSDGIHLTPAGAQAYAALVLAKLG